MLYEDMKQKFQRQDEFHIFPFCENSNQFWYDTLVLVTSELDFRNDLITKRCFKHQSMLNQNQNP